MAQQHECSVDVVPAAQEGEGACDSVGHQDLQAGDGARDSVGHEDLQSIKLVIDIGGRTIEIPLKGKLVVQTAAGGDAAANGVLPAGQDDQKYLDKMRGWLITVATLFVGIAFQGGIQPPAWVPDAWHRSLNSTEVRTLAADAGQAAKIKRAQAYMARFYVAFNTSTFATALTVVIMLLVMKKGQPTRTIKLLLPFGLLIAIFVSLAFVLGTSGDATTGFFSVFLCLVVYALLAIYGLRHFWLVHVMPPPRATQPTLAGPDSVDLGQVDAAPVGRDQHGLHP